MYIKAIFSLFFILLLIAVSAQKPEFKAPDYSLIKKILRIKNQNFIILSF